MPCMYDRSKCFFFSSVNRPYRYRGFGHSQLKWIAELLSWYNWSKHMFSYRGLELFFPWNICFLRTWVSQNDLWLTNDVRKAKMLSLDSKRVTTVWGSVRLRRCCMFTSQPVVKSGLTATEQTSKQPSFPDLYNLVLALLEVWNFDINVKSNASSKSERAKEFSNCLPI